MSGSQTWSLRQAGTLAGVTRATARAIAADGLIPNGDLTRADLVVLRASAVVRTLLFSGESQPANTGRELRPREKALAATIRAAVDAHAPRGACVAVFPDDVTLVNETGDLVTTIIAAHQSGQQYLVLPVGQWLHALEGEGAVPTS